MNKALLLLIFTFLIFSSSAQSKYTISGFLEDGSSGEKLIAATLYDRIHQSGVVSNTYGFYSLTLPKGTLDLFVSYVGFANWELKLELTKDTVINIKLVNSSVLKELIISAERSGQVDQKIQMSQVTVPIDQIKKTPALLGEVDVLKVLQLLPGVQGGTEGQNGLYIRGGSPDQNLILLDGVPVYNVSHIGGFFSVFNGDAIKNVTLTTGGFPARHGGRLSSVIEIDMKEGNAKEFHGEGGIGLISSRLTLEGPIWKEKISFLVSGRRTYLDLIASPFITSSVKKANENKTTQIGVGIDAHFYDLNAKINYKINDRHRIFLSAYNGLDVFKARYDEYLNNRTTYDKTDGGLQWGNITSAFRWNWMIHPKLFANTTVTYSKYNVDIGAKSESKRVNNITNNPVIENNLAKYLSGIRDWSAKADIDYIVNPTYRIRTGIGTTWHRYTPGAFQVKISTPDIKIDTLLGTQILKAIEPYIYIENEIQFGALKANLGLHASAFGVEQKWYSSIQPRIGLQYGLNTTTALKASFATMQQYINLLTNERIGLPTDLWVPSTKRIMPQNSWQGAVGLAKTIATNYEFTLEGYYKKMKHVVSYKDGASLLGYNQNWQDKITQGDGYSYGTEWLLQKKKGRTTGWIGYTLSWNYRQFNDLNLGLKYPYKYDRRHDIEVLVSHKFSSRFSLSGSWQYGTGNSVSLPTSSFEAPWLLAPDQFINGSPHQYLANYEIIDGKNNYRMPAYHRMDINMEFTKQKKRHTRTWSFGAYNAYNHANPLFLTVGNKEVIIDGKKDYIKVFKQFSLFPIIPHVMYSFKF